MTKGLQKSLMRHPQILSSDSDTMVYEDSSDSEVNDTEDNFEGSMSFCAKCLTVLKARTRKH